MARLTETAGGPTGHLALRDDDRFAAPYEPETGSHFGAFLMGGVVVAGGLLAFLYYDSDALNGSGRDVLTTASIARSEVDSRVPSIAIAPPASKPAPSR